MNKFLFWAPRILGIIFVLFLMIFSFDVFVVGMTFWQIVGGLFMHNIPALILLISLIFFWKMGIINGIAFILVGIFFIQSLIIAIPSIVIGILFLINRAKK